MKTGIGTPASRGLCALLPVLMLHTATAGEPSVALRLTAAAHAAEVRELPGDAWEVRTTDEDPYVFCEELRAPFDTEACSMFSFDYICPDGLDFVEVFFGPPISGPNRVNRGPLPPATDWTGFALDLREARMGNYGPETRQFRVDFGPGAGKVIRVRNIRIRPMTADEIAADRRKREEQEEARRERIAKVDAALIAPKNLTDGAAPRMTATAVLPDDGGSSFVSVLGPELDLALQVAAGSQTVSTPVPTAPPLVTGEGEDPNNHTLVRVLNRYGVREVQFLAYPPEVRGGVQVFAGRQSDGRAMLVAAPLAATDVREVRVFGRYGSLLASLPVPPSVRPPYAIAVGNFLPGNPGDEIAAASRHLGAGPASVAFLSPAREAQAGPALKVPGAPGARLTLAADAPGPGEPARLLVHASGAREFLTVEPGPQGKVNTVPIGAEVAATGVFPSAFDETPYAFTTADPMTSRLGRIRASGTAEGIDVGARENLFWYTYRKGTYEAPEGTYTRRSDFAHIRTDFGSPKASEPDFSRTDEDFWAGDAYRERVRSRLRTYDTDLPTCWEPCFTHRWFYGQSGKWMAAQDPETGLPSYVLLDRDNTEGTYGEFGETKSFVSGTYAPGVTPVECFYTYPQRVFLHELVTRFRANPEHFVAVEPNHEMEINAESNSTHGDYNPNMIRGFCRYLLDLYGSVENINRIFGTPFSEDRFDAPRDLGRGPWDGYAADNAYYLVWMRYLNYVIYRVIAGTYREALLAGFPPEAIKCHQIPDIYAIAGLTAFSRPAQRITPIDWNLTAGVGYGFTRYGVWYKNEFNCVQGPRSSGFDSMVIGEYQSLTPSVDDALGQLRYMRDNGVQFVHCMVWPQGHDRGFNKSLGEALNRLAAEDSPRPGVTGGTGCVRPFRGTDGRRFDIVSVGVGPERRGLIKSITPDGSWEGTVYAVPFRARVDVRPLPGPATVRLTAASAPVAYDLPKGSGEGTAVDLSFRARSDVPEAAVVLSVFHHGVELRGCRVTVPVGREPGFKRIAFRVNLDADDLRLAIGPAPAGTGTVVLEDLAAVLQSERTARIKKGQFAGEPHRGGVTFDLIPAN